MNRRIQVGVILVGMGLVASVLIGRQSEPLAAQAASTQAPHRGEGGLPQFEREPNWPKVPAKYKVGFGSAVAGDREGHVWIFSRPRQLDPAAAADTRPIAPPVMEFDQAGNFLQGWGGESGPGYQWPSNEHGLFVDAKGFVWLQGNADGTVNNPAKLPNDNQILKFTPAGKFVMAIGKSGQTGSNKTEVLRGATSIFVYAKTNEVFVSDGYGNSRIVVYDADTGKFKRKWGAYGHEPLDEDDRPKRSAPRADPWLGVSESLQQFASPVHDVKVSDDGLVYVCDRGNKRVQVFTLEGKFVAEQFVGLDNKDGLQARGAAFSPDQRFLYVGGVPVVYILNRKTLEILGTLTISNNPQGRQPGHQLGVDNKGNLYIAAEFTGGATGGPGAIRFTFKGYSAATK
jgi:DNA-binding beta-propeller fold protein YncE